VLPQQESANCLITDRLPKTCPAVCHDDQAVAAFLDPPMLHYFRCKFANLPADELQARIEETLKFLFISHECTVPSR
jgi:hypothetical protein